MKAFANREKKQFLSVKIVQKSADFCQMANPKKAGFTIIELIVVLAIFAVIMSIALFNQVGLNSNIMITNLAYETALAVREAQTYGISVRATASGLLNSSNFDKGYGAYFDIEKPNQIIVFGDSNGDNKYDDGSDVNNPSELQSLYEIKNQRGNKITHICVSQQTGVCNVATNIGTKFSIMFKRPNPEANFYEYKEGAGSFELVPGPAIIVVNNADNTNCRAIVVEITGQIRVENSSGGHCKNAP